MAGGKQIDYDRFIEVYMQAVVEKRGFHWVASQLGRTDDSVRNVCTKLRKSGVPLPFLDTSGPRLRLTPEVIERLKQKVNNYKIEEK